MFLPRPPEGQGRPTCYNRTFQAPFIFMLLSSSEHKTFSFMVWVLFFFFIQGLKMASPAPASCPYSKQEEEDKEKEDKAVLHLKRISRNS